ncbi:hypothetical protein PUR71_17450 [Streptomyces sp. SP17BM10]|uniref:hypothetical protein n=1 Tax=Streptomyces sp. SP17BM10 TaxID=3002530 RepID=UPI002E7776A6|nr:hypothetical protein [Streptomyces sp. SP17BM10]MEE1784677.1 hypothetical protein [Streptomyces sp. SP17BM10]
MFRGLRFRVTAVAMAVAALALAASASTTGAHHVGDPDGSDTVTTILAAPGPHDSGWGP